MQHTFVIEEKIFYVNIQKKEFGGKNKFVLSISKGQENKETNGEDIYILNPINLSSDKGGIPENWNTESECLNWVQSWVERNSKKL